MSEGWLCPVCKVVYAPWVSVCHNDHTVHASSTNVRCTCTYNSDGTYTPTTAVCPVHQPRRNETTVSV